MALKLKLQSTLTCESLGRVTPLPPVQRCEPFLVLVDQWVN